MKRKFFSALLSLAVVAGLAIAERPQVSLSATGPIGVEPREPYTFVISYRNVNDIVVTINNVMDENLWVWPWQEEDPEWRTKDFTDDIPDYDMRKMYVVTVINSDGQDEATIIYQTRRNPHI